METTVPLPRAETSIVEAIRRLEASPPADRAFVVIEEVGGAARFVQFCVAPGWGGREAGLLLDLPALQLDPESRHVATQFLDSPKPMARLPTRDPWQIEVFQQPCRSADEAGRLAMRVLREVHQLSDVAVVRIVEEVTAVDPHPS